MPDRIFYQWLNKHGRYFYFVGVKRRIEGYDILKILEAYLLHFHISLQIVNIIAQADESLLRLIKCIPNQLCKPAEVAGSIFSFVEQDHFLNAVETIEHEMR